MRSRAKILILGKQDIESPFAMERLPSFGASFLAIYQIASRTPCG
ncbi:hypothetical protein BH10PSE12_BH10PSE12_05820 [soil metagenome]